jgi:hypothetical protein
MSNLNSVNINNLRNYLKSVIPTQSRIEQSGYTNQVSLVNAVSITSL